MQSGIANVGRVFNSGRGEEKGKNAQTSALYATGTESETSAQKTLPRTTRFPDLPNKVSGRTFLPV
jgi:hypothetical protein